MLIVLAGIAVYLFLKGQSDRRFLMYRIAENGHAFRVEQEKLRGEFNVMKAAVRSHRFAIEKTFGHIEGMARELGYVHEDGCDGEEEVSGSEVPVSDE